MEEEITLKARSTEDIKNNNLSFKDLVIRLTDLDPFFLYNLVISEEDFQR